MTANMIANIKVGLCRHLTVGPAVGLNGICRDRTRPLKLGFNDHIFRHKTTFSFPRNCKKLLNQEGNLRLSHEITNIQETQKQEKETKVTSLNYKRDYSMKWDDIVQISELNVHLLTDTNILPRNCGVIDRDCPVS